MSDEEDEYEYEYDDDDDNGGGGNGDENMDDGDNDDNDGDFEYTDEDEPQDDAEVALENAYYNAKGLREVDFSEAAAALQAVIVQEQNELSTTGSSYKFGQWSYKSMKQLVKLHLRVAATSTTTPTGDEMGSPTMIIKKYNQLLECISSGTSDVSPAAVENGISRMLERVARTYTIGGNTNGNSLISKIRPDIKINRMSDNPEDLVDNSLSTNSVDQDDPQCLALAVYDATLTVFHPTSGPCKNERLWFKTTLKYGQLLYEMNETTKLQHALKELLIVHNASTIQSDRNAANSSGGGGTTNNSTNSVEIYALQIQLYSRQKDYKKVRETYNRAINVMGGIPHPRTLALIHELGGKMHMMAREYENAGKTFFQAFKSYDEAGDVSRLRCLKYLVLASMLYASTINPFDSQEARPYRDDPEIVAMTELVSAFQNNEIQKFENILKKNSKQLLGDEFIHEYIADLLRTIRTQVLSRFIRPYSCISLDAIASALNDISVVEVEQLLVQLILSGSLKGKIDRVNSVLLKQPEQGPENGSSAGSTVGGVGSSSGSGISSSVSPSTGGASNSFTSNNMACNENDSDIIAQCEAMEAIIETLSDLSVQVVNTSYMTNTSTSTSSALVDAFRGGSGGRLMGGGLSYSQGRSGDMMGLAA